LSGLFIVDEKKWVSTSIQGADSAKEGTSTETPSPREGKSGGKKSESRERKGKRQRKEALSRMKPRHRALTMRGQI